MKTIEKNKYRFLISTAKYSFIFIIMASIIFPILVNADVTLNTKIENPLGNGIDDIPSFIEAILNIVLIVGVPIVALAIIYTGFLFVKAQGNSEKLGKAKDSLLYTIIGAMLLLGAFVVAEAIQGTVDEIKSNAS